jgi:hypothetical protein
MATQLSEPPAKISYQTHNANAEKKTSGGNPLDRFGQWVTLDPIAFFTFMLATFTGCLVVVSAVQIRFLIRADYNARKSADALPAMERAYLFLMPDAIDFKTRELRRRGRGDTPEPYHEPDFLTPDMEIEEIDREIIVRFHFTNYGRTPAIITAIHYDLKYFPPTDRDPGGINEWPTIPRGRLEETLAIHPITSNGHSGDFDWVSSIRHEQWEDAQRGLGHIIFWGLVVYEDVFNRQWETAFGYWYLRGAERFVIAPDNELNHRT